MKLSIKPNLSAKSRRFLWYLIGIATVAFILRVSVAYQLKASYSPVASPSRQTDNFTYIAKGMETADGNYDYSEGFYYQPFYYAVFLPSVFKIFGDGDTARPTAERYRESGVNSVIVAQSLVGTLTVILAGLLAATLFGRRCGLMAAVLLALARMPIFFTPFTLIATLQGLLMTLMVLLAVLAARRKSLVLFAVCGLVAGCANLTRGNIILLLPLIIALAAWCLRHEWKRASVAAALLVLCFVLPQLPFSIINYKVHRKWVGPSSAGPAVLALGNTPEAPPGGREPHWGAGPMAYPPAYGLWMKQHESKGGDHVSMSANIRRWAVREPLAYAELKMRMLLLYLNRLEVPNNVSILQAQSPLLHGPFLLDFWLIGSLGFAGMIVAVRRFRKHPAIAMCALTIVGYSLSIILFYVLARFRVPMIPLLTVFAAMIVDVMWRRRKTLLKKQFLRYLLPLIAGFVLTCSGYQIYRYGWERQIMRVARPHGVHIAFPDKHTVKDHGPQQFGGWLPNQVPAVVVKKTFAIVEPELWEHAVNVRIKLWVAAETDQELAFEFRNQTVTKSVQPGMHMLTLEVPDGNFAVKPDINEAAIEFGVRSLTGAPFFIYIDTQRNYQRSQLNGKPVDGELVLEAELNFDNKRN